MPLRRASLPTGPDMQLYRRIAFGRLAQFDVLDTRQYRTDQPCGDGTKPPCGGELDPQAHDPRRKRKRSWLTDGLAQIARHLEHPRPAGHDGPRRSGLRRTRKLQHGPVARLRDEPPPPAKILRRPKNLQPHRAHRRHPQQLGQRPARQLRRPRRPQPVGAEFVGTSISSSGDGNATPARLQSILAENPFVKFHNAQRGYVRCEVTPKKWQTDFQVVEYVTRPARPGSRRPRLWSNLCERVCKRPNDFSIFVSLATLRR